MNRRIGIFPTEDKAIQMIRALQKEGVSNNEITVLIKDNDLVTRLQAETGVEPEDVEGIANTRESEKPAYAGLLTLGFIGSGRTTFAGNTGFTGTPAAAGALTMDKKDNLVSILEDLDFAKNEAKEYAEYLKEGDFVIVVETERLSEGRFNELFLKREL